MEATQQQKIQGCVETIVNKIKQTDISNLHPPFFPKCLTKFRQEHYEVLKKHFKLYLGEEIKKQSGQKMRICKIIRKFVNSLDEEYFEGWLENLREPYIRKMFQENYGFDDVDFKKANQQFHLRAEIQNTLNQASEWLIQVQCTQDLLSRIQLYFDIKTPVLLEKLKKQGVDTTKNTWAESLKSSFRTISSFALRKTSKIVQANFLTAMAPAAAMLSFAIMGGTATLPWKSDLNLNAFIPGLVVMVVPFVLDGLAENLQKNQMYSILEKWAISYEKMSTAVRKYNQFLNNAINACCNAQTTQQFDIEHTNLSKYMKQLIKSIKTIEDESEDKIQEMRQRTEAYFRQYIELKEGEWTIVLTKQQYQQRSI